MGLFQISAAEQWYQYCRIISKRHSSFPGWFICTFQALSYLSLPDLLITALSHSSAKPFKQRLLSWTSVRLHREGLAKVKDKEKTKLMRKLTKTNCPEAHFMHRTISLLQLSMTKIVIIMMIAVMLLAVMMVMMMAVMMMTGQDIADYNGQGGSGQGCWRCSCFWSSW